MRRGRCEERKGVRFLAAALTIAAVLMFGACGGGGGNPGGPSPDPGGGGGGGGAGSGTRITITSSGASPRELTITVGQRVTFVNNDARVHEMHSDPHPQHGDCPQIDQVGFLNPGQSKDTGAFTTARTCGFHDHNQPTVVSLTGRIIIR
jgi:plastocyanin